MNRSAWLVILMLGACTEYDLVTPPEEEETNEPDPEPDIPEETDVVDTEEPIGDDPIAVCSVNPEEVTPPFQTATFMGEDSYDPAGHQITRYRWTLVSKPNGSSQAIPGGLTAPNRNFTADLAGDYVAELVVGTDDGRESDPCQTTLTAIPTEDLWVEMFWSHNDDDMDLHLIAPGGTDHTSNDCYFSNCTGTNGLEWGAPGAADNPKLDLDDIPGVGPENINMASPFDGIYTVAVKDYTGTGPWSGDNNVTINVYLGGSLVFTDTRNIPGEGSFVRFAQIDWAAQQVTGL